jgi:4-hydroxy-tetrahydrodipicolinate synthase
MNQNSPFTGILVPLITPFEADGKVASDALEALAHEVLDAGASGIVALGTTGEPATLDAAEKAQVLEACTRVCRERGVPLVVGAGSNDTLGSAVALADFTGGGDVAAALVPVPYFTRPSEAGVLAHFAHLSAVSPVPLIVYHIPQRTGLQLSAGCLRAIGALPGVVGVKYATGAIDSETVDLLGDLPTDFAVLAGDDSLLSPLMALGASGGIVASAHFATESFVRLAAAWQNGDVARARELGHELSPVSAALFAEPNPTVLKGVLHAQGRIPSADARLPLLPAASESVETALRRLADL